jgi:non-ribosomal peptide synthetase component E (peptide arylation enzyme)
MIGGETLMDVTAFTGHESSAKPGIEQAWRDRTLIDAFEQALGRTPEKTLVVAGDARLTYRQVAQQVELLAGNLTRLGIEPGDVISVQLPNWAEFVVIHLAVTKIGAVTNPLLPIYRAKELKSILSFAKTKLAFIPDTFRTFDYPPLYRELAKDLPNLKHVCVVGGHRPADMLRYASLVDPSSARRSDSHPADGDDVTLLLFTSGTESSPKGVLHTHNSLMFGNVLGGDRLKLTSDEIIWAISPVAHSTGLEWNLRQAIVLGATIVMQEIWEVDVALSLIEQERCTFTTAATPFASMLLESSSLRSHDLSCLRTFLCGGAAIPATLGAEMLDRVGCVLVPCWGMSECFAATMSAVDDPEDLRWGWDGRPMPGTETAIFDETRTHRLSPGEVGEIATRGPHVSRGYFNDPDRTAETFSSDGWLFSNDLGLIGEDGYLRVVGRKKDIINRGGLKISAAEIEEILISHPSVRSIAIVGIPDSRLGEKACACVVSSPGCEVSLEELVAKLKADGVSSYKWPEYIAVLSELPMTPTGKVQKFKLREDLLKKVVAMVGG